MLPEKQNKRVFLDGNSFAHIHNRYTQKLTLHYYLPVAPLSPALHLCLGALYGTVPESKGVCVGAYQDGIGNAGRMRWSQLAYSGQVIHRSR